MSGIRTMNSAERVITGGKYAPIVVPALTITDVIPDQTGAAFPQEIAGRFIQNVGSGILLYAIGSDCNPNNFNGVLAAAATVDSNGLGQGGQVDVSEHRLRISVYSVAGTTVAVTILNRTDEGSMSSFIKGQAQ